MYKCECGKEFENSQSFNGHKSRCKTYQMLKYGSLEKLENSWNNFLAKGNETRKTHIKERKEKELFLWIEEKHTCEKCGKVMTEKFGSGRFCSRSCANSKAHSEETKQNTSSSLKKFWDGKGRKEKNPCICKICGNINCEDTFCNKGKLMQIKTLIKYFNFNEKLLGTPKVKEEWNRVRDELYKLYWLESLSTSDIAKLYNYPRPCNISGKIFVYLDIPRKTLNQVSYENYLAGKIVNTSTCYPYKSGWHLTWNNKKVYLRSSYEEDYASYLDQLNIDYEVENFRIKYWDTSKNKWRVAVPDFYLPLNNKIVEIKSFYTLNKQNMIDKATTYKKLGYNFEIVIEHKTYLLEDLMLL